VGVISGRASGKEGQDPPRISQEVPDRVEGVNVVKKHKAPTTPGGERRDIEFPAPIAASKTLMLLDPKSGAPTARARRLDKEGKLERI